MKQVKDFNNVQAYAEYRTLPKGAYVLKIMQAVPGNNEWNSWIEVSFDIAEGEYKDFYMTDWKNQTGEDKKWRGTYRLYETKDDGSEQDMWRARTLKTFTTALEESNAGYHWDWDESKWKGLFVGGLFRIEQYQKSNGEIGNAVRMNRATTVECVRTGDYRLPNDRLIETSASTASTTVPGINAFVDVVADDSEELPFK